MTIFVSGAAGAATAAATTATAAAATETAPPLKYLLGNGGGIGDGVVVTVPSLPIVNTILASSSAVISLACSSTLVLSFVFVLLSLSTELVVAFPSINLFCSIKSNKRRVTGGAVQLGLRVVGAFVEGL